MNQQYWVSASNQGVTSTQGLPVSFATVAPNITAAITHSLGTRVVSGTVYFTATTGTNGTQLSNAWTFGDGTAGNGLMTSHVYTRAGSFTVVFTATDRCGFNKVATTTLTIAPACTQVTGLGFNYAPAPVVVQQATTFTATFTSGSPAPTFAWRFDGGAAMAGPSVAYTFTTTGTHTVALTATNTCGAVPYSGFVNVNPRRVYLPVVMRN
jgi:PKD repeat protein